MNKTPADFLAGLQALATVTEDQFETTLTGLVADFQASFMQAGATAAPDPIVSATLVIATQSGVVTNMTATVVTA